MSGFDGFIAGGGGTGGSAAAKIITVLDSPYILTVLDFTILCDCSGGPISVLIPAAAGLAGKGYNIKKIDASANIVTVTPNGAETIDGQNPYLLIPQWDCVSIQTEGTEWFVL
jgi:hypothetical protein